MSDRELFLRPISGAMGEGMGMGMGGNMGMGMSPPDPPAPPPSPPPPSPPPAREPHFVAVAPGAKAGSMWISGSELHYVDPNGSDYAQTGSSVATPPGVVPGSIWMDDVGQVLYIDASGVGRLISLTAGGPAPGAVIGSIYVEPGNTEGIRVNTISGGIVRTWWNGF